MEPIRKAQDRAAKIAALQSLIDEAEVSGPSALSQAELLAEVRREAGVNRELQAQPKGGR
jgi:antitoxin ParD1/3/4